MTKSSNNKNTQNNSTSFFDNISQNITKLFSTQSDEEKYKNFYGKPMEEKDKFDEFLSEYSYVAEDLDLLAEAIEQSSINKSANTVIISSSTNLEELEKKLSLFTKNLRTSDRFDYKQDINLLIPHQKLAYDSKQWGLISINLNRNDNSSFSLRATSYNPNNQYEFTEEEASVIENSFVHLLSDITLEQSQKPEIMVDENDSGVAVAELIKDIINNGEPDKDNPWAGVLNESFNPINIRFNHLREISEYQQLNNQLPNQEAIPTEDVIEEIKNKIEDIETSQKLDKKLSFFLILSNIVGVASTLRNTTSIDRYLSNKGLGSLAENLSINQKRRNLMGNFSGSTTNDDYSRNLQVIRRTRIPSLNPSAAPTSTPTSGSIPPTSEPTDKSNSPSLAQTAAPSQKTNIPTITTINPTTNQPSPPPSQVIVNTNSPTNLNTNSSSPSSAPSGQPSPQTLPPSVNQNPTLKPTSKVTGAPSFTPTFNRSTSSPTIRLTDDKFPTSLPSSLTGNPTGNPSRKPSSSRPSFRPSLETITESPTRESAPVNGTNSNSPTLFPSGQPSPQTPAPTVTDPNPTSEPTDKSNSPSLAQTAAPSQETNIPTITTINPTTNQPSPPSSQIIVNTNSPTNLNTNSSSPSSAPSGQPSPQTLPPSVNQNPTLKPTSKVTGAPSFTPTFNRSTSSPTIRLTDDKFPTSLPSSLTGNPTGNPSRNPSSSRPSFRPSLETITESPTIKSTPVNGMDSNPPSSAPTVKTLAPSVNQNQTFPPSQQPSLGEITDFPTLYPSESDSQTPPPSVNTDVPSFSPITNQPTSNSSQIPNQRTFGADLSLGDPEKVVSLAIPPVVYGIIEAGLWYAAPGIINRNFPQLTTFITGRENPFYQVEDSHSQAAKFAISTSAFGLFAAGNALLTGYAGLDEDAENTNSAEIGLGVAFIALSIIISTLANRRTKEDEAISKIEDILKDLEKSGLASKCCNILKFWESKKEIPDKLDGEEKKKVSELLTSLNKFSLYNDSPEYDDLIITNWESGLELLINIGKNLAPPKPNTSTNVVAYQESFNLGYEDNSQNNQEVERKKLAEDIRTALNNLKLDKDTRTKDSSKTWFTSDDFCKSISYCCCRYSEKNVNLRLSKSYQKAFFHPKEIWENIDIDNLEQTKEDLEFIGYLEIPQGTEEEKINQKNNKILEIALYYYGDNERNFFKGLKELKDKTDNDLDALYNDMKHPKNPTINSKESSDIESRGKETSREEEKKSEGSSDIESRDNETSREEEKEYRDDSEGSSDIESRDDENSRVIYKITTDSDPDLPSPSPIPLPSPESIKEEESKDQTKYKGAFK